ncbi:hypothetical protein LUX57_21340 [Actinomadura madurae]|nr:hypothetical protein [Actinomadura madurae]MCP9967347.1 hypothetical protein [Actinomadura madurae]MCP9979808.1 hypothetical protein [Actinomadura madurae]
MVARCHFSLVSAGTSPSSFAGSPDAYAAACATTWSRSSAGTSGSASRNTRSSSPVARSRTRRSDRVWPCSPSQPVASVTAPNPSAISCASVVAGNGSRRRCRTTSGSTSTPFARCSAWSTAGRSSYRPRSGNSSPWAVQKDRRNSLPEILRSATRSGVRRTSVPVTGSRDALTGRHACTCPVHRCTASRPSAMSEPDASSAAASVATASAGNSSPPLTNSRNSPSLSATPRLRAAPRLSAPCRTIRNRSSGTAVSAVAPVPSSITSTARSGCVWAARDARVPSRDSPAPCASTITLILLTDKRPTPLFTWPRPAAMPAGLSVLHAAGGRLGA